MEGYGRIKGIGGWMLEGWMLEEGSINEKETNSNMVFDWASGRSQLVR